MQSEKIYTNKQLCKKHRYFNVLVHKKNRINKTITYDWIIMWIFYSQNKYAGPAAMTFKTPFLKCIMHVYTVPTWKNIQLLCELFWIEWEIVAKLQNPNAIGYIQGCCSQTRSWLEQKRKKQHLF